MNTATQQRTTNNKQQTTVPPCPHFGPCGGCQLQNLIYSAQLELKSTRLRALLDATNLTLPELQLHPSPPLGYRNRIRLTLAETAGQLRAGYLTSPNPNQQQTTNNEQPVVLPITQCPIAAPILWRTTESLLALINADPIPWLRDPHFKLDQLELFTSANQSALQLTLYVRTAAKTLPAKLTTAFTAFCETLCVHAPELSGAGIAILPIASSQRSRRTELARPGPTWGAPGLNYTVSQPTTDNQQPATYWVPRAAFFQINRFLLPELLALVTSNRTGSLDRSRGDSLQGEKPPRGFLSRKTTLQSPLSRPLIRGTGLAWDLYAGVGLFARALAQHFARVTAVEAADPSFAALASTKLPNLQSVKATTLDFLRTAVVDRDRPDLIVLDPPRTGAGPEICALLGRIAAPTLIYVSCSPETLPSDLQTLTTLAASGYTVAELHLLDLFPQTTHIETIAILTRAKV